MRSVVHSALREHLQLQTSDSSFAMVAGISWLPPLSSNPRAPRNLVQLKRKTVIQTVSGFMIITTPSCY